VTSTQARPESTLGVGIIGVSPLRGWAATAHVPALRALPNYEIRALSAHSAESARAAGDVLGVSAVFLDHEQLVTQPDIDVVAVTVKVPHHRELLAAALVACKAVYCEYCPPGSLSMSCRRRSDQVGLGVRSGAVQLLLVAGSC